ncbi:MAG: bifunctional riboflavin kinase/FAD synthetase [Saprospiraceae bacterium]|jgi:riboflavin kinase/FMN adenylyltransferase|nr:bifunctional riboflavin kinase/FAD synthetase [Saprospiraceae bacterium]
MNIYRDIKQLPPFQKSVITIGSFDGVHTGHRKILERVHSIAREIHGESVVVTFYPHPRSIVDSAEAQVSILQTLDEKLFALEELGIDNVVVVPFTFEFSQLSPREYIEAFIIHLFHPSHVVIGYDHRFGMHRSGDITLFKEYAEQNHFHLVEIPRQEIDDITVSSTKIRKALLAGNIEDANLFLARPYIISGKVVKGDQIGTKLGYPTANIQIKEKGKLIPKQGVYAAQVWVENVLFDGMLYIGTRPTVSQQEHNSVEVHLFDIQLNLYEKNIKIQLLSYIREDQFFENTEQLKEQLKTDELATRVWLADWKQQTRQIPRVTIAILNYNGVDMLESYLPMMEYSSSKYELSFLIIDNCSKDLSVDFIREWYPEIQIRQLTQNHGFAEGYNIGLEEITTEYTVIINSDVLVEENWLDPIIEFLDQNKNVAVIQPAILSLERKEFYEYAGAAGGFLDAFGYPFCRGRIFQTVEKNEGQYDERRQIFWASGAAMVLKTEVFHKLGGFDPSFFAHQEEIDLCWRIKQAGYEIWCLPDSKVYHLGGGTLPYQHPKKDYLNFRNNLYMLTKNESLLKLLWLIPLKLILDGLAALQFMAKGKPASVFAIFKAHMMFYSQLPAIFERRNKEFTLIQKAKINPPNMAGRYSSSILWKYFCEKRKTFTSLR